MLLNPLAPQKREQRNAAHANVCNPRVIAITLADLSQHLSLADGGIKINSFFRVES